MLVSGADAVERLMTSYKVSIAPFYSKRELLITYLWALTEILVNFRKSWNLLDTHLVLETCWMSLRKLDKAITKDPPSRLIPNQAREIGKLFGWLLKMASQLPWVKHFCATFKCFTTQKLHYGRWVDWIFRRSNLVRGRSNCDAKLWRCRAYIILKGMCHVIGYYTMWIVSNALSLLYRSSRACTSW